MPRVFNYEAIGMMNDFKKESHCCVWRGQKFTCGWTKIFLINNYFQTLKDKDIFEKMYICQVFLTMAGIILAFQLHHFHHILIYQDTNELHICQNTSALGEDLMKKDNFFKKTFVRTLPCVTIVHVLIQNWLLLSKYLFVFFQIQSHLYFKIFWSVTNAGNSVLRTSCAVSCRCSP